MVALALVFCPLVAKFFAGESVAAMIDVAVKEPGIAILGLMFEVPLEDIFFLNDVT